MENVGNWLKAAREARGISLQEAEALTRIRVRYLEALETGDYGAMLGGDSQVRGFLRRYASCLGLSPDEAVTRYEREVYGEGPEARPTVAPRRPPAPGVGIAITSAPARGGLPIVAVVGAVLVVALMGLGGWWLVTRSGLLESPEATPAPIAATSVSSPRASQVATPGATEQAQVTPTFAVAASGGVTLTLQPVEHVWVRVTVDGIITDETMLAPSNPITRTAQELVVVETGNGAGLIAIVNGQVQGPLGGRGELCARGWEPEGEVDILPPSLPTSVPQGESS